MAQVSMFKFTPGSVNPRQYVDATDQANLSQIAGTIATRKLWSDAAAITAELAVGGAITTVSLATGAAANLVTIGPGAGLATLNVGTSTATVAALATLTTLNVGTGAAMATMNVGVAATAVSLPGSLTVGNNLTVNGTVTTVNTTNLVVADPMIYANSGGLDPSFAGMAWDQGAALDVVFVWNPTNNRIELGRFNTVGGTVVPAAALVTLTDLRPKNLLLAGDTIAADASLAIVSVGDTVMRPTAGNKIRFAIGASEFWQVASTGDFLAFTDNTTDIGAVGGNRPRTIYAETSVVVAANTTINNSGAITTATTDLDLSPLAGNRLLLRSNGLVKWSLDLTGNLQPSADNTLDIGAAGGAPKTVFVSTSLVANSNTTLSDLTLTTTAGDLTVGPSAAASVLKLKSLSTTTPFNQVGDTALSGFTATSVIGALNELKTGVGGVKNTYTADSALALGDVVYVNSTGARHVEKANATNAAGLFGGIPTQAIGFADAAIGAAASGLISTNGRGTARFIAGLALVNGDEVFLAKTAGQLTNDVSGFVTGDTIRSVGYVTDASTYTGAAGAPAQVQIVNGVVAVV